MWINPLINWWFLFDDFLKKESVRDHCVRVPPWRRWSTFSLPRWQALAEEELQLPLRSARRRHAVRQGGMRVAAGICLSVIQTHHLCAEFTQLLVLLGQYFTEFIPVAAAAVVNFVNLQTFNHYEAAAILCRRGSLLVSAAAGGLRSDPAMHLLQRCPPSQLYSFYREVVLYIFERKKKKWKLH